MQDSLLLLIVIACPSHLYQLQFQANLIKSAGNVFWLCLHYAANAHHGVTQLRLGRIKTNAKHSRDELGLIRPFGEAVDMDYGLIYLWCCESLLSDRYLICFICCNKIFIFDNTFTVKRVYILVYLPAYPWVHDDFPPVPMWCFNMAGDHKTSGPRQLSRSWNGCLPQRCSLRCKLADLWRLLFHVHISYHNILLHSQ